MNRHHKTPWLYRAASSAAVALCCHAWTVPAQAADGSWYPYPTEAVVPPLSPSGKRTPLAYVPLDRSARKWHLCVSFPHLKDEYWLGVNYGVVDEAGRLGVKLQLVEAGGYANLGRQISQIEDCVSRGADAVVIGAISSDGLNPLVESLAARKIPVVDLVNGINSPAVSAKSLVSFHSMGWIAGEYLAKLHPAGTAPVKVGWFPGPAGAAWVEAANRGFLEATRGSALVVLDPKYGDTGKAIQTKLLEDTLKKHPDVSYLVGTAVTAEAGVSVLRSHNLVGKVKLLSFYMTADVYQGIGRGRILAAPADSMVIQGRVAIDQAVRLLEGKDLARHVGPKIVVVDGANYKRIRFADILPPPDFRPVLSVD